MKKTVYIVILIIILSNLPFIGFFLKESYNYSNLDGSFVYAENGDKGKSYWGCERKYGYFLCQHPEKDQGNNRLYRNFTIKPWLFWEWGDMLFHNERFQLPYLPAPASATAPDIQR